MGIIKTKQIITIMFIISIMMNKAIALQRIGDKDLSDITGQSGVSIIIDNLDVKFQTGLLAIGGDDGLGIPAAPDGAWFVFDNNRTVTLEVEKGAFDIDVFTNGPTDYMVDGQIAVPKNTSAALINFGEAYFHIKMSDTIMTLKFSNNKNADPGDGITNFSKTVMNFALNGTNLTIKSDDAKMFVYAH